MIEPLHNPGACLVECATGLAGNTMNRKQVFLDEINEHTLPLFGRPQ